MYWSFVNITDSDSNDGLATTGSKPPQPAGPSGSTGLSMPQQHPMGMMPGMHMNMGPMGHMGPMGPMGMGPMMHMGI